MATRRPRNNRPVITAAQKKVIIDLLLKIVGDTIKGKMGRIIAAGAVAAAATYMDVEVPPPPKPVPALPAPVVETRPVDPPVQAK